MQDASTAKAVTVQEETASFEQRFTPGPVLLLGAPGVGKGTQAKLLMGSFAIPQISTGDLLRSHRKNHTELGLLADQFMRRGELVPDDLVNRMVARRLAERDCDRGYVLDGFPRTLTQAAWLDGNLNSGNAPLPVVAISIRVQHDELLHRVTGRRICPKGHIYNVYSQPPVVAGVCDVDGLVLGQRSDDTEAVFEQRIKSFIDQTTPVVEHYRAQGRFAEVEGALEVEQVQAEIEFALERLRRPSSGMAGGR